MNCRSTKTIIVYLIIDSITQYILKEKKNGERFDTIWLLFHLTVFIPFLDGPFSSGPKYLLKLQQEFNASRVLITMECMGNVDNAGGEGHSTIKKYLSEIKDDGSISSSGSRCRELDHLRAYYYLAVLEYWQEILRAAPIQAEDDGIDGMPTGNESRNGK